MKDGHESMVSSTNMPAEPAKKEQIHERMRKEMIPASVQKTAKGGKQPQAPSKQSQDYPQSKISPAPYKKGNS